ncbi:MAG TPA: hypothetical protein PKV57_00500, partial [Bacilli bacterium]|nr:hypothetical protein [Bacilli bacterium]
CYPFDKHRKIVFSVLSSVAVLCLIGSGLYTYLTSSTDPILNIKFLSMSGTNYFVTGLLILFSASIYIISIYFLKQWKEAKKDD